MKKIKCFSSSFEGFTPKRMVFVEAQPDKQAAEKVTADQSEALKQKYETTKTGLEGLKDEDLAKTDVVDVRIKAQAAMDQIKEATIQKLDALDRDVVSTDKGQRKAPERQEFMNQYNQLKTSLDALGAQFAGKANDIVAANETKAQFDTDKSQVTMGVTIAGMNEALQPNSTLADIQNELKNAQSKTDTYKVMEDQLTAMSTKLNGLGYKNNDTQQLIRQVDAKVQMIKDMRQALNDKVNIFKQIVSSETESAAARAQANKLSKTGPAEAQTAWAQADKLAAQAKALRGQGLDIKSPSGDAEPWKNLPPEEPEAPEAPAVVAAAETANAPVAHERIMQVSSKNQKAVEMLVPGTNMHVDVDVNGQKVEMGQQLDGYVVNGKIIPNLEDAYAEAIRVADQKRAVASREVQSGEKV